MSNIVIKTLMLVMGVVFSTAALAAPNNETTIADSQNQIHTDSANVALNERESLFPEKSRDLRTSHFTWGAEIGSSIDLSSHDMSTMDLDVIVGYKNDFIRTVGLGIGLHRAIGNGSTFIPLYIVLRSSFTNKPSLCFLHLKAGYSFNSISDSAMLGDVSASVGLGINLAMTKRCMSHIILAYGFRHFSVRHSVAANLDFNNISLAQLSFGINF